MTSSINRAQFLRGNFTGRSNPLRPPWSLPEPPFVDCCTRCDQCISVCPEKILRKGHAGFPQVDFTYGECTFCTDCSSVCESGAIQRQTEQQPWHNKAVVEATCLAVQGVICVICAEQCDNRSISFTLQAGKVALPQIDLTSCTGCGACYRPCPANAITIQTVN